MKSKFLFSLTAMLLLNITVFGQIAIEQQDANPLIKIHPGLFYCKGSDVCTYSLIFKTSNQFDEPLAIGLGETKKRQLNL